MGSVEELLSTIASAISDDAWSDYSVDQATGMLHAFDPVDWQQLKRALPLLSNAELQRLAYVLANSDPDEACSLLIQMIDLGNSGTALAACDSLRAMLESRHKSIRVSVRTINHIRTLAETAHEPWKGSCERLLKYLSPS